MSNETVGKAESSLDGPVDDKESFRDKMKHVWAKMNPVSERARTDINIMKGWTTVDNHAKRDIKDTIKHPEINKVAEVRRGIELCPQEKQFVSARKERVQQCFASYIAADPDSIHPDDIPTIAFGGSGGGYRAMLGMLAYTAEMQETGLWDLLTYVAGVSGSCWSLAAQYTFGRYEARNVLEHCKQRFGKHPLSDEAIRAVLSAPGGVDMAFGPLETKSISGLHIVPMDYYSVLTSGHIFLHHQEQRPSNTEDPGFTGFKEEWFKWSNVGKTLATGAQPMPLLTAVRHERPWKDWTDPQNPFSDPDYDGKEHAEKSAWFQWYAISPFEVECDEIQASVPTWAFGRPFEAGRSTMGLPEQSLALLLGLCTSAPAGSMDSYIGTLKRNLPSGFVGAQIRDAARHITKIWGSHGTQVFEGHHPLHACNEHNFVFHLTENRPPGLENSPRIHLIDSGMDNNCPTYVMLHPSRKCDVIINMDASSDVVKDQQGRIDQIGGRRGMKFTKRHDVKPGSDGPDKFKGLYGQIYDGMLCERPETVVDSYGKTVPTPPASTCRTDCTMIYMPLLPNEGNAPGFDPTQSEFSSSYNLIWTPEQVATLVKTCRGNFKEAEPTVKQILKEVWEKKRDERLSRANDANREHGKGASTLSH